MDQNTVQQYIKKNTLWCADGNTVCKLPSGQTIDANDVFVNMTGPGNKVISQNVNDYIIDLQKEVLTLRQHLQNLNDSTNKELQELYSVINNLKAQRTVPLEPLQSTPKQLITEQNIQVDNNTKVPSEQLTKTVIFAINNITNLVSSYINGKINVPKQELIQQVKKYFYLIESNPEFSSFGPDVIPVIIGKEATEKFYYLLNLLQK